MASILKAKSAAAALLIVTVSAAGAADWPMFRGNAARTGYASEQAAPPFTEAWTFAAGDSILSSPAVYDGIVYFGSRDGRLYARDARTGAAVWNYRTSGWVESSPCVSSDTVYAVSMDGYLYALDRQDGSLKWLTPLGAPSVSSPLASGGKVYVGTGLPDKKLKVFDAQSGAPLGSLQAQQPVDSAPAVYGQNIYFGANDGDIYALDSGTLLPPAGWTNYPTAGSFRGNAVAVAGGAIYALPGHDEKKVFVLDPASGNQVSTSAPVEQVVSWQTFTSPSVAGDRLYFSGAIGAPDEYTPAGENYLSALDTGTLAAVWASSPSLGGTSDMGILSSPALAGELVFSGTADGRLLAISSAGVQATTLSLSSAAYSSPAVSNGMVYIGDMGGRFFAFSSGRTAAISSPRAGGVVNGTVMVYGYVANPALAGYTLEYSTGGSPAVWQNIVSSSTASSVSGAPLGEWDVSALANGEYTLRLTALETGATAYANTAEAEVRVNAVPQPPSALSASDVPGDGGNNIALSWTASPTAGISSYRVYRDGGAGFALLASTASAASYTDSSAVTGSTFTYAVRAFDGYLESEDSNQASAFSVNDTGDDTPPSGIADLEAAPGSRAGTVSLGWTAPGDDGSVGSAAYFAIGRTTVPAYDWSGFDAVISATATVEGPAGDNMGYDADGLFGGVTYYFAIKAYDEVPNASGLSNIAAAYATVDTLPPLPPTGLMAADTPGDDGGSITLTWTLSADDGAGSDDVYGYKVYRRAQTGTFVSSSPYAEVAAGVWSYRDGAAAENIRYYYAVSAFDSSNDSQLSGEVNGVSADNYRFVDASAGGYFLLPDGARVDVPGNALSQNDSFIFVKLDPVTYEPLAFVPSAANANPTNVVYRAQFKNSATTLTGRARITLPYTSADVAGMDEENLRIYTLSNGAWVMLNTSSVDEANDKVSAEVSRFSVFRIMEYLPSGAVFADNEVYTYPNPARGDTVTFKFRVAYKSYVKIDVYNVAGEKVAALERQNCPAGQASEIAWDVRNIASGIYIYRMEAQSPSGSRSVIKKLGIAH